MLDEFARMLIESAKLPDPLTGEGARDFVSTSYLRWLAQNAFSALDIQDPTNYPEDLNRLSLVTSILQGPEEDDEGRNPTAFLIAEAADIARMFFPIQPNEPPISKFRRAVHYLDSAAFFHISDYDANANILAQSASDLLSSAGFVQNNITTEAHLSYYRCLAYFLQGKFGLCEDEATRTIATHLAEERAFVFLRDYLVNLTRGYRGEDFPISEDQARISNLSDILQEREHSLFALAAEVKRLIQFGSLISQKSLYRILAPVFEREQLYLIERISGYNNRGYPFAWPPTREFYRSYFKENAQHAIITVPTGGGKGFLAELAAVHALRNGWILYLAPTNALCAQVRDELRQNLQSITDVEAFLGKLEYTAELPEFRAPQQVLVITPEKALLLLKREPDRFATCSLVVLDECHILGERKRGVIAEMVLAFAMAQNPEIRIIMMSALVKDSDKLARWLQHNTGRSVAEVPSLWWRPTRIARITVLPERETLSTFKTSRGATKRSVEVRAFADVVTPWENETPLEDWLTSITLEWEANRDRPWRNDVARKIAEQFTENEIRTLLFVIKNRHHAFSIAGKFQAKLPQRPDITEQEQDLYTLATYELGTDSAIEDLVKKGIAVHTSTMLDCERKASEIAFANGRARALVATPTLAQGLNLVAEAVIICGTQFSEYGDLDMSPEELQRASLKQVLNAAGRAARANITCRGVSVIVPDRPLHIGKGDPKSAFLNAVEVLAMKDASLPTHSSIRAHLENVQWTSLDQDANAHELLLLSLLPTDQDALRLTIQNSLGASEMDDVIVEEIVRRLAAIKTRAVESGYSEWVLRASSLAGIQFPVAEHLKQYIEDLSNQYNLTPPDDTFVGWETFLIKWLHTLPADDTWDLLQLHIKAWRYSRGSAKDPDLLGLLRDSRYPQSINSDTLRDVASIWDNIESTVKAWLEGKTFLEIGEILTRRPCAEDKKSKRTDAGHYLPRSITWSQRFIEHLSRFAGLLLALHNQWTENEPDSMPKWFSKTVALHTFPLGLRFGVQDPFALAWYRNVIQERRAANLLRSLVPFEAESIIDQQSARQYIREARTYFLQDRSSDDKHPVIPAIRRIIARNSRLI